MAHFAKIDNLGTVVFVTVGSVTAGPRSLATVCAGATACPGRHVSEWMRERRNKK